jgi:hypothetical protein
MAGIARTKGSHSGSPPPEPEEVPPALVGLSGGGLSLEPELAPATAMSDEMAPPESDAPAEAEPAAVVIAAAPPQSIVTEAPLVVGIR